MEEAEQSDYVAQLKAEFDSCDTASSGFLGPQEVTALCRKLQLDGQLPLMLDSLLGGGGAYARVEFEAFKNNFVDVLSRSLDLTSDDDSSYLQPVVADEVQPKFVRGEKRYGRRSRPDVTPSRPSPSTGNPGRSPPAGVSRPKVHRSASLDSVESLKWDEEASSRTWADFQPEASQHEEEETACNRLIGGQLCTQEHGESEQVTVAHFQNLLCGSAPVCCSTPHRTPAEQDDASPSLLTSTPGPEVLSRLDDGSGCASPEMLVALWTDEGIRDARDILQTLDLSSEERVSLHELTLALDNELLVSGNAIHQVALICYKNEIQHLRARSEQAGGERDKAKADLERVERRNLQLLREADERLAGMEALKRTRIRELEQDFRERLAAQRSLAEQESDAAAQQLEQERRQLRRQLGVLEVREAELREELGSATQEKARLEEELADVKRKLSEAENGARRLHTDLKQLMKHKFGSLDAVGDALDPEDKLERLLEDCEHRCRELRDQNDELSSELEILKSHKRIKRKSAGVAATAALSWSEAPSASESDTDDDDDMKRRSSSPRRATNHPDDATAAVSIQTEFALEKLKAKHKQEMQQLSIQMETQVNYYERSLERMRQSMEVERKDIAQAFKLEISELEDQKAEAERQAKMAKETLDKLHDQLQHGGWWSEQERRMQRERADSEQNFAREIGNLVQRLSAEKDQLEAELKLKMDQEVMMVREEAARQLSQMKLHHAQGQRRLLHHMHLQRWDRRRRLEQQKTRMEEEEGKKRKLDEEQRERSQLEEEVKKMEDRRLEEQKHSQEEKRRLEEQERIRQERSKLVEKRRIEEKEHLQREKTRVAEEIKKMEDRRLEEQTHFQEEKRRLEDEEERLQRERSKLEEEKRKVEEKEHLQWEKMRMAEEMKKMEERRLEEQKHFQEEKRRLEEEVCLLREQRETQSCRWREGKVPPDEKVSSPQATSRDEKQTRPQRFEDYHKVPREAMDPKERAAGPHSLQVELPREALKLECTEEEELVRLRLEKRGYMNLADHLCAQIVEMEEETRALRESSQVQHEFEQTMKKQLVEMENMVLLLQDLDGDQEAPARTHLEEAHSDNAALQERLCVLQQEVDKLDEEVADKRRKLEEMEQQRESSRQEVDSLHQEMVAYRQEVVSLSGRNAELSANNAELSARLREGRDAREDRGRQLQEEAELERKQRQRLEEELSSCERKLSQMEAELHTVTAKRRTMEAELRREAAHGEGEAGHRQLSHTQEVSDLHGKLRDCHQQVEEAESNNRKLMKDNEEKDERNWRLLEQVQQLQKMSTQVVHTRMARMQAEGQADAALALLHQEGAGLRERAEQLLAQLQEEQRRSRQLEEELQHRARHNSAHANLKEEQHEKALATALQKTQEVEVKLKACRAILREKVQQLQQQMEKNVKSSVMLKDLYVENSQLMKTLQRTEQRLKKQHEEKTLLEGKVDALNRLLGEVVPAALHT
ncbi:ninein-like protein isoform X2 [Festucalex cinctus]